VCPSVLDKLNFIRWFKQIFENASAASKYLFQKWLKYGPKMALKLDLKWLKMAKNDPEAA
jgi:hypothetical protein